jgi:beta-mannosidase
MKHTRMKLKTVVKNLHEGWKFRQARLTNWYPATVPGVVHTDLLQNKIIEDPFFRLKTGFMKLALPLLPT